MKKILKGILLLLSVIALVYNYFIKADAEVVYGINVEGIQIDIDMHLHTGTWEVFCILISRNHHKECQKHLDS